MLLVERHERHGPRIVDLREAGDEFVGEFLARREEPEANVLRRQLGDERPVKVLVGRLDWPDQEALALDRLHPSFPLVGIGPDREPRIRAVFLDLVGIDADTGIERDHAHVVGEQRIDVEFLDRRAIHHKLRQLHQRRRDAREVGRRPVAIAFEQLANPRLRHEVERESRVERRKRHGRIVDDLGRGAARAE